MTITKSELIKAYESKERVRTMNYRGSLLCTSVCSETDVASAKGNVFYISLIPYGATLKSVYISFNESVKGGKFNIGIAGINNDGSYTDIKSDLLSGTVGTSTAGESDKEMCTGKARTKTIHELLCDGDHKVPTEAFEPYSKNTYGVLFLKTDTHGTLATGDADPTEISVNLEYVEPSPSFAALTKMSV